MSHERLSQTYMRLYTAAEKVPPWLTNRPYSRAVNNKSDIIVFLVVPPHQSARGRRRAINITGLVSDGGGVVLIGRRPSDASLLAPLEAFLQADAAATATVCYGGRRGRYLAPSPEGNRQCNTR